MPKVDISVGDLVVMVENGELRLPEMQRRYVWTSTRVRDLFDSLYRGYPSGTILVWETLDSRPTRDMAVPQSQSAFSTSRLLLDGQQRLTSLSAVLRGVPVRVRNRQKPIDIAFNLDHPEGAPSDLSEIEDDQEIATSVGEGETQDDEPAPEEAESIVYDRLARRTFAVGFRALFSRPNWILVSDVFKGGTSDWELLKRLVSGPDDPAFGRYQARLNRLRKIKDYQYVMQVLDRNMTYSEVTEIFVRVNSLGAKLRSSDLALAQITAKWQNSLHIFEEYIEKCEENWFTIDMGLLARAIVMFATGQSRFTTVGSLTKDQLRDAWEKTKVGMDYAINFLRSNAGIEDESLLSSAFLMLPIAFYGAERGFDITSRDQKAMLRWLYVANYKGHYSGSVETTLDVDLRTIRETQLFESLLVPLETRFGRLHVEAGDLVGKGERSGLFALSYLALKHAGAKDWKTGLGLSLTHQGHLHYIEYHHIFPKSLLSKHGFDRSEINEIANMAFISGRVNRQISNKPPKDYLPVLMGTRGQDVITKQAIPLQQDLWELTNYRAFLERRRETLARLINEFVERTIDNDGVISSDL